MERQPRPPALRLIVIYKIVKTPVMFGIALWLTFAAADAMAIAVRLVEILHEHGGLWWRLAEWISPHLSHHALAGARLLAWLDGAFTLAEAVLLWMGKPWGEWLVVIGLASLLPFEVHGFVVHRRLGRAAVLALNVLIVVYLARRRLAAWRAHRAQARR